MRAVLAGLAMTACAGSAPPVASPATTVTTAPATPTTTEPATSTTTSTVAPTTTTATVAPAPAGPPAVVVSRANTSSRIVALTFDAGADTGFAATILDVLDRAGVAASFGITGRWASTNPDLVRRMAAAGHVVMNHTWEHRSFTGVSARPALLSPDERRADLERADEVIRSLTGHSTRPWFRAPYGDYDASVNALAGALGYRWHVHWSVDSLGWQGLSPAAITARCLERAVPGAILLFHVGASSQDAAALPAIIAGLRQRGYGFATVAELIGS